MKRLLEPDTFLYNLKWTIYDNTIRPVKGFFHWLIKSCAYARLLRNDYDWDHTSLLQLIHFKMDRIQKHIEDHNIHTDSKETAERIRHLMQILDRLIKDDYMTPRMSKMLERNVFRSMTKAQKKLFKEESKKEELARQRDEREFFEGFQADFRRWWC